MKTAVADGADFQWSAEAFARRRAASSQGRGYLAETIEQIGATQNGAAMATGTANAVGVGLARGDLVANQDVAIQTGGSSLTLVKAALCTAAGLILAVSADFSAAAASAGKKAVPMLAGYRLTDDDFLYHVLLSVGTTGPVFRGGTGQSTSGLGGAKASGGAPAYCRATGVADLVVGQTLTLAGAGSSDMCHWAGLY